MDRVIEPGFSAKKKKISRFEEMWLVDKGCGETVEGVWQARYDEAENMRVIRKIENCGKELTSWSRDNFDNDRRELEKKKKKELTQAERQAVRTGDSSGIILLKKEINVLMGKEERMWKQRARISYIKEGDRNTRFFHCHATQRKWRNCITSIRNQADEMCSNKDQIEATFVEFYQHLFTSSNPEMTQANLDSIPKIVTREMNEILTGKYQEWEVEAALK